MAKRQQTRKSQSYLSKIARVEAEGDYEKEEEESASNEQNTTEEIAVDENGFDVGEKRKEEEEEEFVEEKEPKKEASLENDPYQKWYGKREFSEREQQIADSILKQSEMKSIELDAHFQAKVSANGIDCAYDGTMTELVPIKAKLQKGSNSLIDGLRKNARLFRLFQYMSHYHDVFYSFGEEISKKDEHNQLLLDSIVLHCLNHVLKSNDIERAHVSKLKETKRLVTEQTHLLIVKKAAEREGKPFVNESDIDLEKPVIVPEYKDQGFTRPKVLILCPFRYYGLLFVESMIAMLPKKTVISGKSKAFLYFGEEKDGEEDGKKKVWEAYFPGNNDDCFRMGISLTSNTCRFFSDFYNSDIIIASPLSLKQIESTKGYDFLSSIEICIIYGHDMINMQNIDHLKGVMEVLNRTIVKDRNTDYSRLREYYLNGYQKYMRQTISVGCWMNSALLGLWKRCCYNVIGRVETRPLYEGSVSEIVEPPRQLFIRINAPSPGEVSGLKLKYLENNVIKILNNSAYKKILLYCDNYFEYIYVKRLLMENCDEKDCGIIDEYMEDSSNTRNRSYFINGTIRVLLFSGRFEYFKRMTIKGINTIYFVSPPSYPEFYTDFVNNMKYHKEDGKELSVGVTVLYTKYDTYVLERIVGTSRYKKMITGKRDMYLFC